MVADAGQPPPDARTTHTPAQRPRPVVDAEVGAGPGVASNSPAVLACGNSSRGHGTVTAGGRTAMVRLLCAASGLATGTAHLAAVTHRGAGAQANGGPNPADGERPR